MLRRDVANATSGRIFYCIRMYLLLRQDVFFFPFSLVKLQKNDRKSLVLNRKSSVFAQYFLSFRPKIPLKRLYFTDFMPKVVIGGNKVTIKTPLIATRYSFIISVLRCEVADVALIWRKNLLKNSALGVSRWNHARHCTSSYVSLR